MGFERYVDYALDVPLYFVKRGDVYHDVAGASFRDLLEGRLAALPGERATISDWANHLSTIFPEVRLKRYLEMRGADVGPPERILRAGGADGRSLLRSRRARRRGRTRARLDRRGAPEPCATTFRASAWRRGSAARACARSRARRWRSRAAGWRGAGATPRAATRPSILRRWTHRRRRPRPGAALDRPLQRPLGGSVDPVFREAAI